MRDNFRLEKVQLMVGEPDGVLRIYDDQWQDLQYSSSEIEVSVVKLLEMYVLGRISLPMEGEGLNKYGFWSGWRSVRKDA